MALVDDLHAHECLMAWLRQREGRKYHLTNQKKGWLLRLFESDMISSCGYKQVTWSSGATLAICINRALGRAYGK